MSPDETAKALARTADNFRQFSRNGRWGTCGHCPRDSAEHAYPEFCVNAARSDHQLDIASLAGNFVRSGATQASAATEVDHTDPLRQFAAYVVAYTKHVCQRPGDPACVKCKAERLMGP